MDSGPGIAQPAESKARNLSSALHFSRTLTPASSPNTSAPDASHAQSLQPSRITAHSPASLPAATWSCKDHCPADDCRSKRRPRGTSLRTQQSKDERSQIMFKQAAAEEKPISSLSSPKRRRPVPEMQVDRAMASIANNAGGKRAFTSRSHKPHCHTFYLRFWSHQCANYTHHGVDGLTDTTLWQREPAKLPTAPSPCDTLKKVMDCQGSKSRISQLGRSTEWMKQLWTTTGEPRITFTDATRGEKDGACTCRNLPIFKAPKRPH